MPRVNPTQNQEAQVVNDEKADTFTETEAPNSARAATNLFAANPVAQVARNNSRVNAENAQPYVFTGRFSM